MNNTEFSITHEAVLDRIYALAALRSLTEDGQACRVPMLTRHEAPALKLVIKDAFAAWIMQVSHWVASVDFDKDDSLDFSLTLVTDMNGTEAMAFRRAIERLLALKTLCLVLSGNGISHNYEPDVQQATDTIRARLAGDTRTDTPSSRIAQHWL